MLLFASSFAGSRLFGVFFALFSFLEAAECSATKAFIAEAGFLLADLCTLVLPASFVGVAD